MALGQLARKSATLPKRVPAVAEVAAGTTPGEHAHTAADPGAAPPGNPQGDHVLSAAQVGSLFIGSPDGVRRRKVDGTIINACRMGVWPGYQTICRYKAKAASIASFTGSERGTSSQCPVCGGKQRVQGTDVALPQPPVCVCGSPGCGGQCQHASAGLWEEDYFPRSASRINERPREGLARDKQPCQVGSQPARCRRPDTGHQEDVSVRSHWCYLGAHPRATT